MLDSSRAVDPSSPALLGLPLPLRPPRFKGAAGGLGCRSNQRIGESFARGVQHVRSQSTGDPIDGQHPPNLKNEGFVEVARRKAAGQAPPPLPPALGTGRCEGWEPIGQGWGGHPFAHCPCASETRERARTFALLIWLSFWSDAGLMAWSVGPALCMWFECRQIRLVLARAQVLVSRGRCRMDFGIRGDRKDQSLRPRHRCLIIRGLPTPAPPPC
jgi:hypothetical protein